MEVPRLVARIVLAATAALLIAPAGASAKSAPASVAPPGSAAVDQYRETAPPAGPHAKSLSPKQQQKLQTRGKDGAALAAVIDRNGGMPGGGSSTGDSTSTSGAAAKRGDAKRSSRGGATSNDTDRPVDQAKVQTDRSAVTSTVGPFPIWTLLIMAAVLVGLGLIVRRRPSA